MPLAPDFVADCPYGPDGILIDNIVSIDRDTSTIVATMPTRADFPITREQRAHPTRHPHHVSGGLMIHATGILGFAHAYFLLDLRHADGWIGYGTHIHEARFRRMARIGPPMQLHCTQTAMRRIKGSIYGRYKFRFEQDGDVIYEGDQSALFSQIKD
jgi:3-hydroxymyristoyl/3-hydroxydecanoyl-(acyl carrier protein) dehydratase